MRRGRYGNIKRINLGGKTFDSAREGKRYQELEILVMAGEIDNLELQPRYPIEIQGIKIMLCSSRYPNGRQLVYVADFRYLDLKTGEIIVEDVKMQSGHRTDVYKIKRALLKAMGVEILET